MEAKVKNQGKIKVESPLLEIVESQDWERVTFPQLPKVENPMVVRQSVPLPAGEHTAASTGISFKGISKNGNQLLFLVVYVDEFGEINLMVTNEELQRYIEPKTTIRVHCTEPRGNYTNVSRIEPA